MKKLLICLIVALALTVGCDDPRSLRFPTGSAENAKTSAGVVKVCSLWLVKKKPERCSMLKPGQTFTNVRAICATGGKINLYLVFFQKKVGPETVKKGRCHKVTQGQRWYIEAGKA